MRQEIHLTDSTIRMAICEHLRGLGYSRVLPETLRIYGYGEDAKPEIAEFQGHVAVFVNPIPPVSKDDDQTPHPTDQ